MGIHPWGNEPRGSRQWREWFDDEIKKTDGMRFKNDPPPPNKYQRQVPSTTIDVYDVLVAWDVTNPAVQHAIKKLLQPGARGHKSKKQDLEEALASIKRAIELEAD